MPLPVSDRVVFDKNPLFGVAAQIRFPTILRIQAEAPAQFQELLREHYPVYAAVNPAQINVPAEVPAEIQKAILMAMSGGLNANLDKAHKFTTADGNWNVQLGRESLTFSCTVYPKWEVFRARLQAAWEHFVEIYKPPFATQVTLRYQNAINRQKLGLSGVPWSSLLKPFIAAEFACHGLAETEVISALHRFELSLGGSNRVLVQHGTATNQITKESVYAIDNNFTAVSRLELNHVFSRLDELNSHSGSLFRLCITDRLYDALKPTKP
jgi:uncharacterized protein (TIGR04255 family)